MYRWASISKPVTAALALLLAEEGKVSLDVTARSLVPEFPEKRWPITLEHLLCNQAGIVHYQHGPKGPKREYDDPDPFRDRVRALDVFCDSPLLFEPGTDHSYSTHGFALAGAVLERAGEARFRDLVAERIAEPMNMTTFRPDFQSDDIPRRASGYVQLQDGRVIESGDSNVAWKLPGGGWISTVGDLARFGAGIVGEELLSPEDRERMFTPRTTSQGEPTGYGLGIGVRVRGDHRFVSHSGGQRKASTFLLLEPDLRLGVALMSNTEGMSLGGLAFNVMDVILDE